MPTKKTALCSAVALGVIALIAVIAADALNSHNAVNDFSAMNTVVSLDIEGFDSAKVASLIAEKTQELDLEELSRTAHGSEIYKINKLNGESGKISPYLSTLLKSLKKLEADSSGAFCISLGALSDLWNIGDGSGYLPKKNEIDAVLKNKDGWTLSGNDITVKSGTVLDLGSAGKGIACDEARKIIETNRCKKAIVAVGGSVLLWSDKDETFKVGVRNPLGEANEYAAIIETGSGCISTSGSYERFFKASDGKTYHHIFNPQTGYPADCGLLSVTVMCESGIMSDALSTACFVLGYEKSLPLLKKYNAQAVFITTDNRFITTPDFSAKLTITNEAFTTGDAQ